MEAGEKKAVNCLGHHKGNTGDRGRPKGTTIPKEGGVMDRQRRMREMRARDKG